MHETALAHELIRHSTETAGDSIALKMASGAALSYADVAEGMSAFCGGLLAMTGLDRGERVAVYLEKRPETVIAMFGTSAAGAAFVPINPILKPAQVRYILNDCNVRVLVTSASRWSQLEAALTECHDLRHLVIVDREGSPPAAGGPVAHAWEALLDHAGARGHRVIDTDIAAILYTSGSTGRPKGVVLSHRNIVAGAKSVAEYLGNGPDDTLLAALPLSFDAGFSQLTTAFHAGARVVLLNYLMPRDVVRALDTEKVTGLTAVPPLWIQIAALDWPTSIADHLRYIANTGGRMPLDTLGKLRRRLPKTRPFLMYGLTEAFRATYLPPEEVDDRPDSIGKAIPNVEVLVLREDGRPCAPNEPGELVQRGALVALGYWNNPEATAERFKPLPSEATGAHAAGARPEIAVFSGDTVRRDEEGFLYFIGRRDEMIKTSGYRVSPTEIEEILYSTGLVGECAAFGLAHETLGQVVCAIVTPPEGGGAIDQAALLAECRSRMPAYMVPARIDCIDGPLPRNQNGKIDRKSLADERKEP